MKQILLGLGALVLLGTAVLAQWPADQALGLLAPAGTLTALDARGTLWRGSAREARWRGVRLGTLRWRLAPASLLTLAPRLALAVSGPEVSGTGELRVRPWRGELVFRKVRFRAPAGWLGGLLGQSFLQLGGSIEGDFEALEVRDGRLVALRGRSRWAAGELLGRIEGPVGDLQVDWTSRDGVIEGRLRDLGGPLRAQGLVTMNGAAWRLDAELRAPAEAVALRQALALLGRPAPSGAVRLSLSGPMVPLR